MLTDIRLQNFRSYKDASFELGPGVNIIVGPNASGKTNLLEAILMLASGKSYRGQDRELIKTKNSWARLDSHSENGTRTLKIKAIPKEEKTFEIDGKITKRLSGEYLMPVVLFEPGALRIISGEPALRREYLDNWLEQLNPAQGAANKKYARVLKQRNALLKKQVRATRSQIFAWNVVLSELGGQIADARNNLIGELNKALTRAYSALSGQKTNIAAAYKSTVGESDYTSKMLKKLSESEELDFLRGFTGHGPHRDDIEFSINGAPMQQTGSRGEVRTLLLALKTIELKMLEKARQQKPLLLLDDVFSELDGRRRKAVTELARDHQTFITTTDADVVIKQFSDKCFVIAL